MNWPRYTVRHLLCPRLFHHLADFVAFFTTSLFTNHSAHLIRARLYMLLRNHLANLIRSYSLLRNHLADLIAAGSYSLLRHHLADLIRSHSLFRNHLADLVARRLDPLFTNHFADFITLFVHNGFALIADAINVFFTNFRNPNFFTNCS